MFELSFLAKSLHTVIFSGIGLIIICALVKDLIRTQFSRKSQCSNFTGVVTGMCVLRSYNEGVIEVKVSYKYINANGKKKKKNESVIIPASKINDYTVGGVVNLKMENNDYMII